MKEKPHPFARTLGPGPYEYVDFYAMMIPSEANGGRNNFEMAPKNLKTGCGTCAHCGTGIIYHYIIQNGIGERYPVGSDCINKIGGGAIINQTTFDRKLLLEKRRRAAEQRKSRRKKKVDELGVLISANEIKLGNLPHPSSFHKNKSALDYCMYVYRVGNISEGSAKYLKDQIERWIK